MSWELTLATRCRRLTSASSVSDAECALSRSKGGLEPFVARGTFGSFRNEFDPVANVVGCLGVGEVRMIPCDMGKYERDDVIISSAASDIAACASDLPEQETPLRTHLNI